MKWNLAKNSLVFAGLFLAQTVIAAETYTIDPNHSYVSWHINHFGFSNPEGKWMANGTLTLDEAQPKNSKADITIKIADVITGLPELDKHLKGKQFFETDKFPTATFVSDTIDITGKETAKMKGTLTVHGVAKPVTLNVKLNKIGENPITNKKTVGFSAQTEVKRSDFGMGTLLPGLGDEVKLEIETEAYKAD